MREADKVKGVCREAQAIANLLDKNAGSNERQALASIDAEINIDNVRQSDAQHKRP